MIDNEPHAGEPPQREHGDEPLSSLLAAFLAELDASRHALDEAFHFDDRAGVKPAYDRLMRIADDHRELSRQLALVATADADAHSEIAATVEGILAVLSEMSTGIERYHDLAGALAGLQSQLAALSACLPQ